MRHLILFLALILQSCTTVGVIPFSQDFQPKDIDCDMQVFFAPEEVNSPFEVTAEINSNVQNLPWSTATRAEALKNARPHICSNGADRVMVGEWQRSWLSNRMNIHIIKVGNPSLASNGVSFQMAMALLSCRDNGGLWQNESCTNIKEDPFSNTKNARRIKVMGD